MLNSGVLSYTADRIRNRTAGVPTDFNGGTPILVSGGVNLLCGSNAAPVLYLGGLPYFSDGGLTATQVNPIASHSGGIPISANGEVAVDAVSAISFYNNGLPYCANGKLAIATPE